MEEFKSYLLSNTIPGQAVQPGQQSQPNQPGQLKKIGNYIIRMSEKIGQGTYGVVNVAHEATDETRLYAVKIINVRDLGTDETIKNMLVREINNMSNLAVLKSPYLVQFYDVKRTPNSIYIIIEYCSGGNLKTYIEKNGVRGTLPETKACEILRDLVLGFRTLYDNKIVHRDIKPQNVLLSQDGKWKLSDFGYSKQLRDQQDRSNTLLGSLMFMAPQICGMEGEYTNKCDVWSLGILLYNMLYGAYPWKGKNNFELSDDIYLNPEVKFPEAPAVSQKTKDIIKPVSYTHLTLPTIYSV
eukprot:TRINITY_DN1252_c0_g1_i5.p1 TRINITY_DN1252_c0_g1~~TRINITY_DN1252_c0_g1_i5.p1  ORF type:complete len:298 (-),score=33.40 TRINITY_DN1252_c0_g1_i5:48-941(-)